MKGNLYGKFAGVLAAALLISNMSVVNVSAADIYRTQTQSETKATTQSTTQATTQSPTEESTQASTEKPESTSTYVKYEKIKKGVISDKDGYVNVRSTPTTSTNTNLLGIQLDYLERVNVLGEDKEKKGDSQEYWVWYHITFTKNGKEYTGYVRSDLINVYEPVVAPDEASIRNEITTLGFPESYIEALVKLKMEHPNWSFVPYFTNYEWEKMVAAQLVGARCLVDDMDPSSWKSLDYGYFDWVNNKWVVLEGEYRVKASREIIEYYMDPRNFFDEKQIFQFELLGYDANVHTNEGIESILEGSFMANTVLADDEQKRTYGAAFGEIGKTLSISPYYLASKVIIEQGRNGKSDLISGKYPGYEGYYNFYNIGATGNGNTAIITNGLAYAKKAGWDTRYKALLGGASGTINSYIQRGQNTLYLQRFDVVGLAAGSWPRQYAQYVWSAYTEASSTAGAYYEMGIQDSKIVFRIPIYTNMPKEACKKPTKDGNPNYKLSALKVTGHSLSPSFDPDVTEYSLMVESNVDSVNIEASAYASVTKISGTGKVSIKPGANVLKVTATAENGDVRTYTITITKKTGEANQLSSLAVEGYKMTPVFASNVYEYAVTVPFTTEKIKVGAAAYSQESVIAGTGEKKLAVGVNKLEVKITAKDGTSNTYVINVTRSNDVIFEAPGFTIIEGTKFIRGFKPGMTIEEVKSKLKVTNGTVKVLKSDNSEATGNVATGQRIVVYNSGNEVKHDYSIVVYGELNGDGKVSLLDYAIIKKYLWGEYPLADAFKEATNVNHDEKISLLDRAYLKQAIWGVIEIKQ